MLSLAAIAAAQCPLGPPPGAGLTLGPPDYPGRVRASGQIRAVMLFVDFPDAKAGETPDQLYSMFVPHAQRWLSEVSNGIVTLDVTPVKKWYRMPKATAEYGWFPTPERHKAYVADAVKLADADVDFRKYQIVYIVASRGGEISNSPTFVVLPGEGVPADGIEIRHAVTFGNDTRSRRNPHYGALILVHETGHLFGLKDLYEFNVRDFQRLVGAWDPMSWLGPGFHFLAWHKAKLGWIKPEQVRCAGNGETTATLAPVETAEGLKAVAVQVSPTRAYFVEAREARGMDAGLCSQGLLVYLVDSSIESGKGPVKVMNGTPGLTNRQAQKCGQLYDAAGKPRFDDPEAGVSIELLNAKPGAYTVRVTKRAAAARASSSDL